VFAGLDFKQRSLSFSGYCGRKQTVIFMIIISGSRDLVRTVAASHRRFRNLVKTLCRTPLDVCSCTGATNRVV
jgi:hypothetical protein